MVFVFPLHNFINKKERVPSYIVEMFILNFFSLNHYFRPRNLQDLFHRDSEAFSGAHIQLKPCDRRHIDLASESNKLVGL